MKRAVKRMLFAIIFIIFYFTIFINFAPQIRSYIYSFVDDNSEMFQLQVPRTKFIYNKTSGNITEIEETITIDLTTILKFTIDFILYIFIPFMVPFVFLFKIRW